MGNKWSLSDSMKLTFNGVELSNLITPIVYGYGKFEIERAIFNAPATIVIWKDGSKTVVKAQNGEKYDAEKGLALVFMKRALGDKGSFNNVLHKWCPAVEEETQNEEK